MEFDTANKYRLELRWSKASYDKDQIATLKGCYFSGPVISQVFQLSPNDHIDLDFSGQYIVFVDNYYIARLSWVTASHTPEKINLNGVTLKNIYLNKIPKLNNTDYIVIDTKGHEDHNHKYNLVYPSYLIRRDGLLYNFRSMK